MAVELVLVGDTNEVLGCLGNGHGNRFRDG